MAMRELTSEEQSVVSSVARNLSYKYNGWYRIERDDVYSECWIAALKYIQSHEGFDIMGSQGFLYNLVERRVLDMIRKVKRRLNQVPYDPTWSSIDTSASADNGAKNSNGTKIVDSFELGDDTTFWGSVSRSTDDYTALNLMELFDEGSREYDYIGYVLLELGLTSTFKGLNQHETFGDLNDRELKLGKSESFNNLIAHKMGFSNSSSSAYKSTKYRVYMKACEELHYDNILTGEKVH